MDLRLAIDLTTLQTLAGRGRSIGKITSESLNRAAEKGRTISVDDTLKQLNLKRAFVFAMYKLLRASASGTRQEAQIRVARRSVGLRNFAAVQVWERGVSKRRPWGVQVQISPSGAPERIHSAFFARLKQGGIAVFRREKQGAGFAKRYPIEVLKSAQPSQVFMRIAPVVSVQLLDQLDRDIKNRAARFLQTGAA